MKILYRFALATGHGSVVACLAVLLSLAALLCYGEEEYYVGVATTTTLGEHFDLTTTWHYGFGWSEGLGARCKHSG